MARPTRLIRAFPRPTAGGVVMDDGTSLQDYLDSLVTSGLPWFVVTDPPYNATGDGSTDDRAAINSAIADLNTAGAGVLYFPATDDSYYCSDGLTSITASALILGDGGAYENAASTITTDDGNADLFTIAADGCRFRGLKLEHTGTATDGSGILVTAGDRMRFEDVSVTGFYIDIEIEDGAEWSMTGCYIADSVLYGMRIRHTDLPDGGDWVISDSLFGNTVGADAHIRYESGGGGKIVGCKFNGATSLPDYAIDVLYTTGAQSSVFVVADSSLENMSADAIRVTTTGTGIFGLMVFDGLQCGLYSNNTGRAINLSAASAGNFPTNGGIGGVVIDGIVARTDGTARAAVNLTNTDRVTLGEMALVGFNARYTSSGDTNTIDGQGASALDDLTDVTITAPQEDDTLRYVGAVWINDNRRWEAVTDGEDVFVWDGDDLVHEWEVY